MQGRQTQTEGRREGACTCVCAAVREGQVLPRARGCVYVRWQQEMQLQAQQGEYKSMHKGGA